MNTENIIYISGAIAAKKARNGKIYWLVVKMNEDSEWEIPKITARRGESTVRASLRMMGEQAGMTAKVLEEAGRSRRTSSVNGKSITKMTLYYLLLQQSAGEIIGFHKGSWFEYAKAVRTLKQKKEKEMLRSAKKELVNWRKEHKIKDIIEEFLLKEQEK